MRATDTLTPAIGVKQHLSFAVAGVDYGMPILKVKEILPFEEATPVPGAPTSIVGVINVRGSVVPVVDLGRKWGAPPCRPSTRSCVLVVETATADRPLVLGVLAERVNEVVDLAPDDVEPPPKLATGSTADFLTGVGKVGSRFLLLLDVDRALAREELERVGELASGAAAA